MADSVGPIARLIAEFMKLPGIGPKSAERITHFLLAGEQRLATDLAAALLAVVERVHPCPICGNHCESQLCDICSDPRRDPGLICIVESPRDVAALERAGSYRGFYHVLHGRLAPLEGIGPEQLTLDQLRRRVDRGGVREMILATSPTIEGDGTALFIANMFSGSGIPITRLARGIPSGGSLELANSQMLADALEGRRTF